VPGPRSFAGGAPARLTNRLTVLGGMRRDVPARLRTMRNAIAWSHELLSPGEQALFRRLSVFVGGFSLEAAERCAMDAAIRDDALDLVSQLVDHSMVQADHGAHGEPRFMMLETIRDFGLDQLESTGETIAARRAHASWVTELAERAEPGLIGPDALTWQNAWTTIWRTSRASEWALDAAKGLASNRAAIWRYAGARGIRGEDGPCWTAR